MAACFRVRNYQKRHRFCYISIFETDISLICVDTKSYNCYILLKKKEVFVQKVSKNDES